MADTSLYMLHKNNVHIFFLIYVDDIIITGLDKYEIDRIISTLASQFPIKELGDISYFLRVEALRTTNGLFLTQRKYVLELFQRA